MGGMTLAKPPHRSRKGVEGDVSVRDRGGCLVPADSASSDSVPLHPGWLYPAGHSSGTGLRSQQASHWVWSLLRWWQHRLDLSQKVLGIPQENSTPREWSRLGGRKS